MLFKKNVFTSQNLRPFVSFSHAVRITSQGHSDNSITVITPLLNCEHQGYLNVYHII